MNHALVSLACHAYVVAALVYLVYLVRQLDALATAGRVLVGTGLGLPVCQEIITSLGGELRVESQPERGSTFTVELPLKTARE